MKTILVLFFLFSTLIIKAQSWEPITNNEALKVLETINKSMAALNNYSVEIIHTAYKDHKTEAKAEIYNGYYKKLGSNFESNLLGIRTVQDEKMCVTIDSSNKVIAISNIGSDGFIGKLKPDALKICKEIKCVKINNQVTALQISFNNGAPFSKIEVYLNKEKYMEKLVMYNNEKVKLNENDSLSIKPRIEIRLINYKINLNKKEDFSTANFIFITNNGYATTNEYVDYKLADHRVKQ